jgi:hypothetical protein
MQVIPHVLFRFALVMPRFAPSSVLAGEWNVESCAAVSRATGGIRTGSCSRAPVRWSGAWAWPGATGRPLAEWRGS